MSKEATGENGAILGSREYWNRVNRATFFGALMRNSSETDYQGTLREIGGRAGSAIDEIYDDLQDHIKSVRAISSDRRSALAKQVQELYDVCSMTGASCSRASECVGILSLSAFYLPGTPFRDERAIQSAIKKIKNSSDFFASECIDLIQKATDWSISFAAGSDAKKRAFLEDVSQGKGKEFLQNVLDEYASDSEAADLRGDCGYSIGSREYRNYMESKVFLQELPATGRDDYDGALRESLAHIANQLQRDLTRNEREHNYITDETARKLHDAVDELERCGVSLSFADSTIDRLAWFVGGDASKIRQLQSKLNELRIGGHLTEDGVFGIKTLTELNQLYADLERGMFPVLVRIDPLQSKRTGIKSVPITIKGDSPLSGTTISSLQDFSERSNNGGRGTTIFRVDYDDDLLYHINTVKGKDLGLGKKMSDPDRIKYRTTMLQKNNLVEWNHKQISEDAFNILKDFDGKAKKIRMKSGKVFAVMGPLLDALELGQAIAIDRLDADKKLGKTTASAVASIGGSWMLSSFTAKAGAALGATVGTAIFPGVGTAIGGTLGGAVFGIAGSYAGSALGEYIIDITVTE